MYLRPLAASHNNPPPDKMPITVSSLRTITRIPIRNSSSRRLENAIEAKINRMTWMPTGLKMAAS